MTIIIVLKWVFPPSLHLFQPWMKEFLFFLKSKNGKRSKVLEKKLFLLTTNVTANAGRKKRAGEEQMFCESCGHDRAVMLPSPSADTDQLLVPTTQLIEELELANVYWEPEQLKQMTNGTFYMMVETLGSIPGFSQDQLDELGKKATEVQLSHRSEEDISPYILYMIKITSVHHNDPVFF